jgi:amidase
LPVGLSFVSTAWTEAVLISLAYDYEQASMSRIPPPMALTSRRSSN